MNHLSPDQLDWLGTGAGTLTTIAFLPQVWKTWRTRSTADLSLAMWSLFSLGVALWVVYGALLGATPIVWFNAITLVLASSLLYLKIRHR
ncbi:MAG: SemiSWEET transporter [bacterium]